MPTWPAACPQFPLLGLSIKPQDAVARTQMDAGPASRRNRFTAVSREMTFPLIFTGEQKAAFDSFFQTTLANGALAFDWIDPVDDATVSLAFRAPPEFTLVAGSQDPLQRLWQTELALEVLP